MTRQTVNLHVKIGYAVLQFSTSDTSVIVTSVFKSFVCFLMFFVFIYSALLMLLF